MTDREKALLHIYPDLAGMNDLERRDVLRRSTGAVSSADPAVTQEGFERAMAAYETVLWDRVDRGQVKDPRLCTKCGRPLQASVNGMGTCREGCETRKVYAWSRDYWRQRLPRDHAANSRVLWKLRQLWDLAQDYLPESDRTDAYLAGICCKAAKRGSPAALLISCQIQRDKVSAQQAHGGIEALKDRLAHAVAK